jgi:aldehyde dehydrogenase (NAD+)
MNEISAILETMEYGPAPEDPAQAVAWLESHDRRFGHFIGGEFVVAKNSDFFETANPATGEKLADIALGGERDVAAAAGAAASALKSWSALPGYDRARHLYALARQVQKHSRLFAVLESLDNGKPIRESRDIDIPLVARHFYYHAGWAQLIESELPGHSPVGVCGQIIPWNFPLLMLAWKVAPALAAGCTVVLKPAEYTPLTAIAFAEISKAAGLPDGVFNIVNGDGSTGALIVANENFAKIAFTGSTEVGRIIRKETAGKGKKLSLELGGKSPFIVYDAADIDAAVEGVVDAIWFNQGEVCCAGSRAIVQEGIADRFHSRLKARMEKLRVGDPLDKAVDMGAVVDPVQITNITERVAEGVASGASLWQPSWAASLQGTASKGCFYPPSLFTDVAPASRLAQEEIFGPVIASMTFRTPAEAIQLANDSRYGLAASVWSQSLDIAFDTARQLKAGVVWINSTNLFDAAAGFGGYRESGFGREGGREGMMEYLVPSWQLKAKASKADSEAVEPLPSGSAAAGNIDRTMKNYVGGKQARPDSGYSYPIFDARGALVSEVGYGNRKDIRNAVEAAGAASAWTDMTGHQRAQVLYFLAENLAGRMRDFVDRLSLLDGGGRRNAEREVALSVERIFHYAAWADKYDGAARAPAASMLSLALNEPWEIMAISCPDEAPLLAMVSLALPAIAMGNRIVLTPSPKKALIAGDFYQLLDTSDVPGGTFNIVTGDRDTLADTLAKHDDVACHWYFGSADGSAMVERHSAGNLKATWVNNGKARDWFDPKQGQGREFLFHAVRIKNIWTPYGF